jgi:hypothetical protein
MGLAKYNPKAAFWAGGPGPEESIYRAQRPLPGTGGAFHVCPAGKAFCGEIFCSSRGIRGLQIACFVWGDTVTYSDILTMSCFATQTAQTSLGE